jgi:flagellar motor protein MotB
VIDGDAGDAEGEVTIEAPIWPAFGDLMSCLFGLFVLFFVWAIAFQVDLTKTLEVQTAKVAVETERADTLEKALAAALGGKMDGRITFVDGRLGIGGAVLFQLASADLQPEGASLLKELAPPLATYLETHDEMIMVSGFTDDLPLVPSAARKDNWDLSASRAVTVVRALVAAGVPRDRIFAAGFGETHPIAPNVSEETRAKNRRVEIAPVPRRR